MTLNLILYLSLYGYCHLIQSTELIGTDVYKIGCSRQSDLSRINKGYHKGTKPVYITLVEHPFDAERLIKKHFTKRFTIKAGTEIFSGKLADMKQCYKTAINEYETLYETIIEENKDTPINSLTCPKCGKLLSRKQRLNDHLLKCDGLNSKQCKICLKLFKTRQGKNEHKRFVKCKPPNNDSVEFCVFE